MRPRFTEQLRTGIVITLTAAFSLAWAAPRADAAEKLTQKTKEAWETYEKLTEKRIDAELNDKARFLRLDFMKAPDAKKVRDVLKSGKVYPQKMPPTLDDKGKEISLEDGLIHHWYGAILIPGVKVDALVRWIQDYNSTS